jgi:hypothetical protein
MRSLKPAHIRALQEVGCEENSKDSPCNYPVALKPLKSEGPSSLSFDWTCCLRCFLLTGSPVNLALYKEVRKSAWKHAVTFNDKEVIGMQCGGFSIFAPRQ